MHGMLNELESSQFHISFSCRVGESGMFIRKYIQKFSLGSCFLLRAYVCGSPPKKKAVATTTGCDYYYYYYYYYSPPKKEVTRFFVLSWSWGRMVFVMAIGSSTS